MILILIVIICVKIKESAIPNEEKMIAYFYKNKDKFEQLKDIAINDERILQLGYKNQVWYVGGVNSYSYNDVDNNISDLYKSIIKDGYITNVYESQDSVLFLKDYYQTKTSYTSCGYIYIEDEDKEVLDFNNYTYIEPNWYYYVSPGTT